jgi:predicted ester cyclase
LRRPKEPSNVAYRFVDGRIAEGWAIRDELTMLRQLVALHP